jgi:hypothetical protein
MLSSLSLEQQTDKTRRHPDRCNGHGTPNRSILNVLGISSLLGFNAGQMEFGCQSAFWLGSKHLLASKLKKRNESKK